MGVIIRQSLKGSIVTYAGAVIGAITTVFLYPYFLTPEIIGLTRVLIDSAMFLAFFAQIGIPNAIVKFHTHIKSQQSRKKFMKAIFYFPLLGFLVVSAVFLAFKTPFINSYSQKSPLYTDYYYFLFPFALFCVYLSIYETYATTLNRITVPRIVREILIRILLILSALMYIYLFHDLNVYIISIILIYGFSAVFNIFYSLNLSENQLADAPDSEKIDRNLIKEIGWYMFFMFFVGIGSNIVARIDTMMISSMAGLEKTGIYSIAFFIATMIEIPSRITLQISAPIIARELKANNLGVVKDIYRKNSLNQAIISGFLMLMVWCNIENIFSIMPKGQIYREGIYVVLFVGLGKLIDSITGVNNLIIVYSKYYKFLLIWIVILSVLIITGNLIFIPLYGISGAAFASLLGYIIINSISVLFVYAKFKIQPFQKKFLSVFILYASCIGINYLLPAFSSVYLDFFLRSFFVAGFFIFFIIYFNISPEIKTTLKKLSDFKNFIYGR